MHYVHGSQQDDNGNFYDTVVPNYYDIRGIPSHIPSRITRTTYSSDASLTARAINIAQQVCEKLGKRLLLAGQTGHEGFQGYGEHIGVVGVEERGKLMAGATAVFVPTTYLEPFGGVHAEALLCGTPVITTNFGVFTETVVNGVNGYRCDTFQDFLDAVEAIEERKAEAQNLSAPQRKSASRPKLSLHNIRNTSIVSTIYGATAGTRPRLSCAREMSQQMLRDAFGCNHSCLPLMHSQPCLIGSTVVARFVSCMNKRTISFNMILISVISTAL